MQGIRSFMGWSHIPEMDSTATTSDDNLFAGPKTVAPGKVFVKMPTEDWEAGQIESHLGCGLSLPWLRGRWPSKRCLPEASQITVQMVSTSHRP